MPITEMLSRNARVYGNEISLIERDPAAGIRREISWRQFEDMANSFANALLARGIKKEDKVALLMMNCLEWLPAYFGILKTGALAVPLNFRYTAEEIKKCLQTAEAQVLVYGPEFIDRVDAVKGELDYVEHYIFVGENCPAGAESFAGLLSEFPADDPGITIEDTDLAALYFTSGTTGTPKAIIHPHSNLVSACITENRHHLTTHEDNFLCIPPLYHTGAKMHWFGSLIVGSRAVLLRGVKPEWILNVVSEEKVSIVWLLVPWAQDILDAIESGEVRLKDYHIRQWRLMHIGAQPVPPSLIQRWKKHFPHQMYDTNYGLSESTGPGCVHLGMENINKVGAIGVPGFNWEALIVDEHGKAVPRGKVGELIVRGPGVMKGYYKNPEATAQVIKDGWLFTGDMARMDKEGFIYLVDRKKDVVISGGENIFPVEIEDFLRSNQDIKDAAVIGLPDRRLGEVAVAIVQLKPGREVSEDGIMEFCQALPRYKRPRQIILDTVPRNATGKIEKPKLREKFSSNCVAQVV
ncbi:MAG TPA: AMP-dependent synthetase [Syntrophomonas sp.]|jgi:acyl-CoA synthetase (AMP-forming)/AMP-acid ligase II|nr:AMP-dependent synthetase [Syntrophomonas sp.]